MVKSGWYPDPAGSKDLRYFDGSKWTQELRPKPQTSSEAPEGWYKDPGGSGGQRYFDGASWTSQTRPTPPPTPASHDPRLAAAQKIAVTPVASSTALRLSRRNLADYAHSKDVLTPTVVEKSSRRFSNLLIAGGVLFLVYALYATVFTNFIGNKGQADLRNQYIAMTEESATPEIVTPTPEPVVETPEAPAEPAPAPEPVAPPFDREPKPALLPSGTPTGIIKIPSIEVDQVFVSGTKIPDLKKAPGIWEYGAFPGTPGNATISGHRTTYGGPFRHIDKLKVGDQIIISVEGQPDAIFEVRGSIIVEPSRVQVTENTPGVRLTLTTCEPVGSDAKRLVVQAELVSGAWADHAVAADAWEIMS